MKAIFWTITMVMHSQSIATASAVRALLKCFGAE